MVEEIYALKNKILQHVERETENMDRINVHETGELVDMIKDLAEAEEYCWEASYYKAVTEAMQGKESKSVETRGYQPQSIRQEYMATSEYDDLIDKLAEEYRMKTPDEKAAMKTKLLSKLGTR